MNLKDLNNNLSQEIDNTNKLNFQIKKILDN